MGSEKLRKRNEKEIDHGGSSRKTSLLNVWVNIMVYSLYLHIVQWVGQAIDNFWIYTNKI